MEFFISASTDIGVKKTVNQDSLFVRKLRTRSGGMVLAVLCDGMGGLSYGEVASASIVSAFTDWMYSSLPRLSERPLEDHEIRKQWTSLVEDQNRKIRAYGQRNGCDVGSTLTAMLLTESRYYLMNIGDTRAYEILGDIRQLTLDHTVVEREVQLGNLTPEQAEKSPVRSVLTKCIGVTESVYPDMFFGDTVHGAVYMLCSDGFRHRITRNEMSRYLSCRSIEDALKEKIREEYLIELNKQRGETDNISVITIFTG